MHPLATISYASLCFVISNQILNCPRGYFDFARKGLWIKTRERNKKHPCKVQTHNYTYITKAFAYATTSSCLLADIFLASMARRRPPFPRVRRLPARRAFSARAKFRLSTPSLEYLNGLGDLDGNSRQSGGRGGHGWTRSCRCVGYGGG